MLGSFITSSHAKEGGPCPECGIAIGMWNRIHKYEVVGETGTTKHGNGLGVWVCSWCHAREQKHPVASEVELWECAGCLKMSNPVMMLENRLLCFACYGRFSAESGRLL